MRRVHERPRDHHALRLPAGEEVRLVARAIEQAELVEQLVGARLALARRHAVVGGVEDQVVADRERAVEVAALRHDRDLLPRAARDRARRRRRRPAPSRRSAERASSASPTVVVLPAPFGPSRPKTSPRATAKETPSTAFTARLRVPLDELVDLDDGGCGVLGAHLGIVRGRASRCCHRRLVRFVAVSRSAAVSDELRPRRRRRPRLRWLIPVVVLVFLSPAIYSWTRMALSAVEPPARRAQRRVAADAPLQLARRRRRARLLQLEGPEEGRPAAQDPAGGRPRPADRRRTQS